MHGAQHARVAGWSIVRPASCPPVPQRPDLRDAPPRRCGQTRDRRTAERPDGLRPRACFGVTEGERIRRHPRLARDPPAAGLLLIRPGGPGCSSHHAIANGPAGRTREDARRSPVPPGAGGHARSPAATARARRLLATPSRGGSDARQPSLFAGALPPGGVGAAISSRPAASHPQRSFSASSV
jgi:hypothetical protein